MICRNKEVLIDTLLPKLAASFAASGHSIEEPEIILFPLARKLLLLRQASRFSKLLSNLFAANNKANLHSLILEATFAYQFESANKPLNYEVRCRSDDEMTIDFYRRIPSGKNLYMEMRQVNQRLAITDLIDEQLGQSNFYEVHLGGNDDRADTLRLQRLILSKAQDSEGNLIKFSLGGPDDYNIIVVEVSDLHLGMIDHFDCMLVTYGDPMVPEFARRDIFGLFQEDRHDHPALIHEFVAKFSMFRSTIHGILFLWKHHKSYPSDFELEFFLVHNNNLITHTNCLEIADDMRGAMNPRHFQGNQT